MVIIKKILPQMILASLAIFIALFLFNPDLSFLGTIYNEGGVPQAILSVDVVNTIGNPITVISNDNDLASVNFWIYSKIGTGGREFLTLSDYSDDVDNISLTKSVEIDTIFVTEHLFFNVNNEFPNTIYEYSYSDGTGFLSDICPVGTLFPIYKPLPSIGKLCVSKNAVSLAAPLSNAVPVYTIKTRVKVDGQPTSYVIIGSQNSPYPPQKDITLNGNFIGSVDYIDSTGGRYPPAPNDTRIAIQDIQEGTIWRLASKNFYENDYRSNLIIIDGILGDYKRDGWGITNTINLGILGQGVNLNCIWSSLFGQNCEQELITILDNFNSIIVDDLVTQSFKIPYSGPSSKTDFLFASENIISGNKPAFVFWLEDGLIKKPEVRYKLKGTALGINISVGIPEIVNQSELNNISFSSGSNSNVEVRVKNVGTSAGNFSGRLTSCNLIVNSVSPTGGITLNPGNIGSIIFNVASSSSGSGTCQGEVFDTLRTSVKDTFSFGYTVTDSCICIADAYRVNVLASNIYRCASDCRSESLISTCEFGIENISGIPICKDNPIQPAVCGNDICEVSESPTTCFSDCNLQNCGDSVCQDWENSQTCSQDCGVTPPLICAFWEKQALVGAPEYMLDGWGLKFWQTGTSFTEECVTNFGLFGFIILIFAGLALLIYVFKKTKIVKKLTKTKSKRRKK